MTWRLTLPVLPNVWFPYTEFIYEPIILLVPVVVLGRPEGVGYPLDAVHDRTGEVVCWVDSVGSKEM